MHGFDLLENFIENPEALLKRTKAKLKRVLALDQDLKLWQTTTKLEEV
jgi:hypothetical protein